MAPTMGAEDAPRPPSFEVPFHLVTLDEFSDVPYKDGGHVALEIPIVVSNVKGPIGMGEAYHSGIILA